GANLQVGKRVTADWKVILGESAVDLCCGRLSKGLQAYQADIVVLCEHHVFVVSSTTGAIIFQKRLEYHPACCTTYPAAESKLPGGLENLLVASHNKALLVYRGNVLCWAARMDSQPVAVKVADISTSTGLQKGMLVTLTDTGGLQVSYLGTDPMLNPVGFVEGKDLDYEAMGREQRALATIIREHAQGKRVEPFDRLMMRAQKFRRFRKVPEVQKVQEVPEVSEGSGKFQKFRRFRKVPEVQKVQEVPEVQKVLGISEDQEPE
ncbi:uncharacterized protein HaLaN_00911, partial [Haematococcus lacustris]